jgi:hypothetical protein
MAVILLTILRTTVQNLVIWVTTCIDFHAPVILVNIFAFTVSEQYYH